MHLTATRCDDGDEIEDGNDDRYRWELRNEL